MTATDSLKAKSLGSSNGGVKMYIAATHPYLCSVSANGQFVRSIFEQKKNSIFSETEALERTHQLYETQLAELTRKCQKNEDLLGEIHTKNLYLESYSRRENVKFTNI